MNTDFPEYTTNNQRFEQKSLRQVTLVLDDENFLALQNLSDNASTESTFDFLSIEVI